MRLPPAASCLRDGGAGAGPVEAPGVVGAEEGPVLLDAALGERGEAVGALRARESHEGEGAPPVSRRLD